MKKSMRLKRLLAAFLALIMVAGVLPISAVADEGPAGDGIIAIGQPEAPPEVTPEVTPVVTPEVSPEVTPEVSPVVSPEVSPVVTPEVSPEVSPAEVSPAVTPEVSPAVSPELSPQPSPETDSEASEAKPRISSANKPEGISLPAYEYGSARTNIEPGTYNIPLSLRNAAHTGDASIAAACLLGGSVEICSNGSAYISAHLGPVTVGELTGWASNWSIYNEYNVNSAQTGAELLSSDEQGHVTAIRFMMPDNSWDGVFCSMYVDAMGMSPDAYIAVDFANVGQGGYVPGPSQEELDREKAQQVIDMISDLGEPALESEEKIAAAEAAYAALSDNQKALVENTALLTEARAAVEDMKAAKAADSKIAAIGKVSLESETLINEARAAFDALTEAQKGYVNNLALLTAAEDELAQLKNSLYLFGPQGSQTLIPPGKYSLTIQMKKADKPSKDSMAAKAIKGGRIEVLENGDAYIEVSLGPVSMMGLTAMASSWSIFQEYNYTSAKVPAEVLERDSSGNDKLIRFPLPFKNQNGVFCSMHVEAGIINMDPEALLLMDFANFGNGSYQPDQGELDRAAAKRAEDAISNIGIVSLKSEGRISYARSAYESLSPEAKALVKNYPVLEAAEKRLEELKAQDSADRAAAAEVDGKIDAIGQVSLQSAESIKTARDAYETLNSSAKSYVTKLSALEKAEADYAALKAQHELNLAAAAEVEKKIAALGEITLASEKAINEARAAYDSLSSLQKTYVSNLSRLESAEKRLAALKAEQAQIEKDKEAAAEVDKMISAIGKVSLKSEAAISQAEAAYNALTPSQKEYVREHQRLTEARAALEALKDAQAQQEADKKAAAEVDKMIAAIGKVSLASEPAVKEARAAYEALDPQARGYVENLALLKQAEAELAALKAEHEQLMEDKRAAAEVDEMIAAIGDVSLASEAAIVSARKAYDGLSEKQKSYVNNLALLTAAEKRLEELKQSHNQEELDKATAKAVDDMIAAIGTVSAEKEKEITAARKAYDALSPSQKKFIKNLGLLEEAEKKLAELKEQQALEDKKAAAAVDEMIAGIGEVTLESEQAVIDAENAYSKLSVAQQALVKNRGELISARERLTALQAQDKLDRAAAADVDEKIASIGRVTLESGNAIGQARAAYRALNSEAKAYVTKLSALEAAEKELKRLQDEKAQEEADRAAAAAVDEKIKAIGKVSLSSQQSISEARAAYSSLNESAKSKVTKLSVLEAAEKELKRLQDEKAQEEADRAAAAAVDEKIKAIGKVSLSSQQSISEARAAYEQLSEQAKSYVLRLSELEAAEAELQALKDEQAQLEADKAAAALVVSAIESIGPVSAQSEKTISEVRAAYDALSDSQKKYVTNYSKLLEAEKQLEKLSYRFGSAGTVIPPGLHSLPVRLMNSLHIGKPSMAASCIKGGSIEVLEDGSAYINIRLGSVTVGDVKGWASDWAVYSGYNTDGSTVPADVVRRDSEGNITEIRFLLTDNSRDGVYVNLKVAAVNMNPDAYIALDFANFDREPAAKSYTVSFSAGQNGTLSAAADGKEIKSGDMVKEGSRLVFTASADEGYELDSWTGVSAQGSSAELMVSGDVKVSVSFKPLNIKVLKGSSPGKYYDTFASVSVQGRVIKKVELSHNAAEKRPQSVEYAQKAKQGMEPKFIGLSASDRDAIEKLDAVTGATGTAESYKSAVINALGLDAVKEYEFGSKKVLLSPGQYSVPVSLKNAVHHDQNSVAAAAFAPMGLLTVNYDGSAVLRLEMRPVTVGDIKDMAYDVRYYKEDSVNSSSLPVDVLESIISPDDMQSHGKTVPSVISFPIPDISFDGVYMSFTVDAMGGANPDAWLKINYSGSTEPGAGGKVYEGSAKVDQFGKYTVTARVSVENGVISNVDISAKDFISTTHQATNEMKVEQVKNALKDAWNGIAPTEENAESVFMAIMNPRQPDMVLDAVSGATYSAKAARDSVMNAFGLEYQDEIINVPTQVKPGIYEVDIAYYSDVVEHSLIDSPKNKACLTVRHDGSMSLEFDMMSGTSREPLYILGFNGVYENNDRSAALSLKDCSTVMGLSLNDYSDENFPKGTQVVNHVSFPLYGGIAKIYNTNCRLYVPAMKGLNGNMSGIMFENGKFSVDVFAKIYWDSMRKIDSVPDPQQPGGNAFRKLTDGEYIINGRLLKTDRASTSMADEGINHSILLRVSGSDYSLTLDFGPISFAGKKGYLGSLSYYQSGYAVGGGGQPIGSVSPAGVISYQRYTDGNIVKDQYGTDYPDLVSFPMIDEAKDDGFVPLQVSVPVMDAVTPGSGRQDVYLKLELDSVRPGNPGGGGADNELPQEALEVTDEKTGVRVQAEKGVFPEKVRPVVEEISSGDLYDRAAESLKNTAGRFRLYNIFFLNEKGEKVQPTGKVTVSYPIPEGWNEEALVLYNIKDDGSASLIKGSVKDGFFVVVQKHFSLYALSEKAAAKAPEEKEEPEAVSPEEGALPEASGGSSALGAVIVILIAAAAVVIFLAVRKKKQQGVK